MVTGKPTGGHKLAVSVEDIAQIIERPALQHLQRRRVGRGIREIGR